MNFRARAFVLFVGILVSFPLAMPAPVVFKPNEKTKYMAPGEEQLSGNAKELFEKGQDAEKRGDLKKAVSAYKALVRRHPKDALAPGVLYRCAELEEKLHQYTLAASFYAVLVERYPTSPHFNEAIEAQFRIGELFLGGKKLKILGIPMASALDAGVEVFAAVVRTAPYGKYTARAQFDIGRAREKQGSNDAALEAYQAVVDKFPNEPVAPDAQYQIGYIWLTAARAGTKDLAATTKAKTAFQDFLFRYPNSEKAAQAKANLKLLEGKQTVGSMKVARFYDKQKNYRAAVIYYNEVIRQQPGSTESEEAKQRIDQLRKKFGDTALQPAFVTAEAEKKKKGAAAGGENAPAPGGESAKPAPPDGQTAASQPAPTPAPTASPAGTPLGSFPSFPGSTPPPATDLALPPSSLAPERSATPEPSTSPEATTTPEATATPEVSATPEAPTL